MSSSCERVCPANVHDADVGDEHKSLRVHREGIRLLDIPGEIEHQTVARTKSVRGVGADSDVRVELRRFLLEKIDAKNL